MRELQKIRVKLKKPVTYFSGGSGNDFFEIRNDETVEVSHTMTVMKLLQNKTLIQVNE